MNNDEECRRQAAKAEKQARLATNDIDRAAWLRVATGWLSLLVKRSQGGEEAFNANARVRGTGQDDSESSH